jgi:small GTP-binding protein
MWSNCRATAGRSSCSAWCSAPWNWAPAPARPGEFSERAFLNDKLDLAQAEAIADLIESGTEAAARAASAVAAGRVFAAGQTLQQELTGLRVFVEAAIDFPDEEIDFLAESDVCSASDGRDRARLDDVLPKRARAACCATASCWRSSARRMPASPACSTPWPGQDSAIVTEIPGTTRDVLRETIDLDGIPVHVADTAGLRETETGSRPKGVRRARQALAESDLVLLVVDLAADPAEQLQLVEEMPDPKRVLVVFNKLDLLAADREPPATPLESCTVSATTGAGLDRLKAIAACRSGRQRAGRRGLFGAPKACRGAAARTRTPDGGAPAPGRGTGRRTGGRGVAPRPGCARRNHRQGAGRRPARGDLRQLLHRQMNTLRPHWLPLLAGLVPIVAAHAAWGLNLAFPEEGLDAEFRCQPYWDGCVSISRAVRTGPGLLLFRALMLPTAALVFLTWLLAGRWLKLLRPGAARQARNIALGGMIGALFLVLYVGWLGTEGPWYGWLRRYGVTFYFGLTALAQLLLVHAVWPLRRERPGQNLQGPVYALFALVSLQWLGGVLSVFKRLVLQDAALIDRIENVIEWWFALALSLAFLAMAELMRRTAYRLSDRVEQRAGR